MIAAIVVLACAVVALVLALVASVSLLGLERRKGEGTPRVVLLRPCEEVPHDFVDALATERASVVRLVRYFVTSDALFLDGPRGELERIAALVPTGPNPKAGKLAAAELELRARGLLLDDDVVLHADADVRFAPRDIEKVVEVVLSAPSAVVFGVPEPAGGTSLARFVARLLLMSSPQSFAAIFALERAAGGEVSMAGKVVALRGVTLRSLGGYVTFAHTVGEDLAFASRVREIGAVPLLGPSVVTLDAARTMRSQIAQLVRWLRVLRAHRPGRFAAYPLTMTPLAVLFPGLAFLRGPLPIVRVTIAVVVGAVLARMLLAWILSRRVFVKKAAETPLRIALAPIADFILLYAWIRAHFARTIRWAGRTYEIGKGGLVLGVSSDQSSDTRRSDSGR